MPSLRIALPAGVLDFDAVRAELEVPEDFSPQALSEAAAGAGQPRLPELDRTDLPLLTIDPPGSRDLDQALHLEELVDPSEPARYRVWYAIADPAAFLAPGSVLDEELFTRIVTLYAPDRRIPLHPPVLGEDAASLLPGVDRPALLWRLDLDAGGGLIHTGVERALVRSRERLDYAIVQARLADGTAGRVLELLRTIGELRQEQARRRGAVDLPTPEQEVTLDAGGRPGLELRANLPSEGWNAQLSLLTGMAAAGLMLAGGVGLLRTLPPPDPDDVEELRRSALALGVEWPHGWAYGEVISALDPTVPQHAALLTLATRLLRGAGYTAFDGAPPEQELHSAVASPYAHCTAPLRRLADRHVGEICLALSAGTPVPAWAREALPRLPETMATGTRRASALDRAVVDGAEAVLLTGRTGEVFPAVVVATGNSSGVVQLADPPVRARCEGVDLPLGQTISVRLVEADPAQRRVLFAAVS